VTPGGPLKVPDVRVSIILLVVGVIATLVALKSLVTVIWNFLSGASSQWDWLLLAVVVLFLYTGLWVIFKVRKMHRRADGH
jgi:hypothetical protein